MRREPDTIGGLLRLRTDETPQRTFVRFPDREITFSDLDDLSSRVSHVFMGLGLGKGDVVASMLPTSAHALAVWFGCAKAGMIQAPVNTEYRGEMLARLLQAARCSTVITDGDYWHRITDISGALPHLRHLIVDESAVLDARLAAPNINVLGFASLLESADNSRPDVHVAPTDPDAIIFTSGTTGPSKGVVRSHAADLAYAQAAIDAMEYTAHDVQYLPFPLFHGFARCNGILPMAMVSGTVVMHPRFSLSAFWETCRREQVTAFTFLGATIQLLMNQPASPRDREHVVTRGHGAPVPPGMHARFLERFGVQLVETYGSSELGIVTANTEMRSGSCGRPIAGFAVEIRSDGGKPVTSGAIGEIVVKPGDMSKIFSGYLGGAAATRDAFSDGWFLTGDIGRLDSEGWLYFIDRKKDVIRRRGENISSWEIESVISSHAAVSEVAVYGLPSAMTEDDVAVAVVLRPGQDLLAADLLSYCERLLPRHAVPKYVRFVDALPKTPTGKVEKYRLRQFGAAGAWCREEQSGRGA